MRRIIMKNSDIWSLGWVIYELSALRPPFTAENQLSLAMKIKSGKIEDLPEQYSHDLQKTIKMMLKLEQEKRPSIEELVSLPQISLRLRERKVKEHYSMVKKKEEEVKKREEEVLKREENIAKKEADFAIKEQELEIKFKQFEEMEKRMVEMKETSKNQSITNSFDPTSYDKLMRNHQSYLLSQNKENVSSNWSYSQPKIDESIDSLRDDFSENKDNKPSILGQNWGLNGTTDISSYTKCKPPSIRKYCRDSSAGAKLRYNYSRENIKHWASTVKEESK